MPLQATSGAASYDAFGGGAAAVTTYIEDVFSTYLYQADGSSTQTINNGIDLSGKGGLVWIKSRSNATGNVLVDTVRGSPNVIQSNNTNAQASWTNEFGSFSSTGFTVPYNTIYGETNFQTRTYTSWTFRKQPKFFDIQTFTGNGVAGREISHALGSVPGFVIVKKTSDAGLWATLHKDTNLLYLERTNAAASASTTAAMFGDGTNVIRPTSTVFTVGAADNVNTDGQTYIAYLFAHDAGGFGLTGTDNVISCGSYSGSTSSVEINLGYEPQWVLIKRSSSTGNWVLLDNMRSMSDTSAEMLFPNLSNASDPKTYGMVIPTATGFTVTTNNAQINDNGFSFIYIAIRRGPMKVPTDGTKVFNTLAHTGDAGNIQVTGAGFTPDLLISKARNSAQEAGWVDRLRGTGIALFSNGAGSENDSSAYIGALGMDGVKTTSAQNGIWNKTGTNNAWWFMKRAPSFFDEVCYTGTGSNRTVTHNLGVAPELMIVVGRTLGENWIAGSTALANTEYLIFNEPAAKATGATYWNSTYPTSSVFSLGTASEVNTSSSTFVAYLFATCAGVSKVGSYTGNGSTQTINCGFGAGGARFVMIKRTNAIGDWYVYDTARGMTVLTDPYLFMNTNAGEVATLGSVTTVSTGFALDSTILAAINVSAASYIFLAIA
jgi:hypothetical protein